MSKSTKRIVSNRFEVRRIYKCVVNVSFVRNDSYKNGLDIGASAQLYDVDGKLLKDWFLFNIDGNTLYCDYDLVKEMALTAVKNEMELANYCVYKTDFSYHIRVDSEFDEKV